MGRIVAWGGDMAMKLGCQEQLLPGADLPAKFEFARRAGFDGIELRARGDGDFARRRPELRAAARAGVVMRTVCPETDHFIGDFDPERRRDAVEQLRTQLSLIAELGGDGVLTPASWGMFSLRLPPFTPPRSPREDRKVLLEALTELAEHAAAEGVWLAIEPINRYEDYMINRLEQAADLAEQVRRDTDHDSLRVCADLFHLNIEEDDMARAIVSAGGLIGHVHVDDSNRLQPGTGHLDFAGVFSALREIRYDGWLTLECRLRGEPETALPAAAAFVRRFL
jgi:sugar phosphate isomerase/epimerase